jgi:LPXTG-motif cell wall-anchored protein
MSDLGVSKSVETLINEIKGAITSLEPATPKPSPLPMAPASFAPTAVGFNWTPILIGGGALVLVGAVLFILKKKKK